MSDHAQNLRQAAEEIRREGHAGWGNACEWAADEIERLRAELRVIAAANPAQWEADVRDQFRAWAQNRARAALGSE